jgi:hypothetical protein
MPKLGERWTPVDIDQERLVMSYMDDNPMQVIIGGKSRTVYITEHDIVAGEWLGHSSGQNVRIRGAVGSFEISLSHAWEPSHVGSKLPDSDDHWVRSFIIAITMVVFMLAGIAYMIHIFYYAARVH